VSQGYSTNILVAGVDSREALFSEQGLLARTSEALFGAIQEETSEIDSGLGSASASGHPYITSVKVSYFKVTYHKKEAVRDLLGSQQRPNASLPLVVPSNTGKGAKLDGLTEHYVSSMSDISELLENVDSGTSGIPEEEPHCPGHTFFWITVCHGDRTGRIKFTHLSESPIEKLKGCVESVAARESPNLLGSKLSLILQDSLFMTVRSVLLVQLGGTVISESRDRHLLELAASFRSLEGQVACEQEESIEMTRTPRDPNPNPNPDLEESVETTRIHNELLQEEVSKLQRVIVFNLES